MEKKDKEKREPRLTKEDYRRRLVYNRNLINSLKKGIMESVEGIEIVEAEEARISYEKMRGRVSNAQDFLGDSVANPKITEEEVKRWRELYPPEKKAEYERLKEQLSEMEGDIDTILEEMDKEPGEEWHPKNINERILSLIGYYQEKERGHEEEKEKKEDLINTITSLSSLGSVSMSKDLVQSMFTPVDALISEEHREKLKKIDSTMLIPGTEVGLSGGNAYLKSFCIVLAKMLNEQSKYFKDETERDNKSKGITKSKPKGAKEYYGASGISTELITEYFGKGALLEKTEGDNDKLPTFNGDKRSFVYIYFPYERGAKEMSPTGKISGGKDVEEMRRYIIGGKAKIKNKKDGRLEVKEVYRPGLANLKYPIPLGNGKFVTAPLISAYEIIDLNKKNSHPGCILKLSPQFSNAIKGYTTLRGDTIQLLKGGKQKEITMDLLFTLANASNLPKLKKSKEELLRPYRDRAQYKNRPSLLEAHFQEAVERCKDAKILKPGKEGYKEVKNSVGAVSCVFYFNPDYLKDVEVDEQPGV